LVVTALVLVKVLHVVSAHTRILLVLAVVYFVLLVVINLVPVKAVVQIAHLEPTIHSLARLDVWIVPLVHLVTQLVLLNALFVPLVKLSSIKVKRPVIHVKKDLKHHRLVLVCVNRK
jgi:hypothetical protein